MTLLTHELERTITIGAPPATVFRFFTDSARWAAWWGAGSTIDPRPGGEVRIVYPGGVQASGEVVEIAAPSRIVFTYGYASGKPIPVGSSRVSIRLEAVAAGTRLHLIHAFADAAVRDEHVQGWRYQLSLFANVVADEVHRDAARVIGEWFDAWSETGAEARAKTLARIAVASIRLRDRYSSIDGADDLVHHIGASQRFMRGVRLTPTGAPLHCQGTVINDWTAAGPDGQVRATGTSVFTLGPDGRIESVVGFWR